MKNEKKQKGRFRYLPMLVLAAAGAVGGYLYYRFIGCVSGTCMISSNPVVSALYGGLIGALIGYVVTPGKTGNHKEGKDE